MHYCRREPGLWNRETEVEVVGPHSRPWHLLLPTPLRFLLTTGIQPWVCSRHPGPGWTRTGLSAYCLVGVSLHSDAGRADTPSALQVASPLLTRKCPFGCHIPFPFGPRFVSPGQPPCSAPFDSYAILVPPPKAGVRLGALWPPQALQASCVLSHVYSTSGLGGLSG